MRIKLYFQLENNVLDTQYRKGIISWIKHSIQDYDENLYNKIYHLNSKKTFCFAPILPNPKFQENKAVLATNSFSIVFSAYNYVYALHLYNSFLAQKYKKFSLYQNSMTLNNIVMIPEKVINSNDINIKLSSPMICRNHDRETLKDMYYSFERDEFEKYIRINIEEQLEAENLDKSILDGFEITPINAKKIVVPVYEKMIECSVGSFNLKGNKELLNYLYKAGIGAKKAMGFGLMEII